MTDDIQAVLDERQKTHGSYTMVAFVSQAIKDAIMTADQDMLTPVMQESLDMIASKIGRIVSGNPAEIDHWRDIAGYAELVVRTISPPHNPKG